MPYVSMYVKSFDIGGIVRVLSVLVTKSCHTEMRGSRKISGSGLTGSFCGC